VANPGNEKLHKMLTVMNFYSTPELNNLECSWNICDEMSG